MTIIDEEGKTKTDKLKIENIPFLKEYIDVFPEYILGLPPKRELDFTIELVPGAVPSSKAPYQMNILELNELKSQLKELIDKSTFDLVCLPGGHRSSLLKRRTKP